MMVITMAKLRMAHASTHGARKHAWRTQAAWAKRRRKTDVVQRADQLTALINKQRGFLPISEFGHPSMMGDTGQPPGGGGMKNHLDKPVQKSVTLAWAGGSVAGGTFVKLLKMRRNKETSLKFN